MQILGRKDYNKVTVPLGKVTINNLFARSVVEHKITGTVYVDNTDNPKTFYVIHPYTMTLLFGSHKNEEFNNEFLKYALNTSRKRNHHEWMQAFPGEWDGVLAGLFKEQLVRYEDNYEKKESGIVELNTRVNFKFSEEKYFAEREEITGGDIEIFRTDRNMFRSMKGSVVPLYFWESEDDFVNNGVAFSLFYKGNLASTAFASFIHGDKLEMGIETFPQMRGKGLAVLACRALIDYCLKNNYEPVWACRLANSASYRLAERIGFVESALIPYYRLSN